MTGSVLQLLMIVVYVEALGGCTWPATTCKYNRELYAYLESLLLNNKRCFNNCTQRYLPITNGDESENRFNSDLCCWMKKRNLKTNARNCFGRRHHLNYVYFVKYKNHHNWYTKLPGSKSRQRHGILVVQHFKLNNIMQHYNFVSLGRISTMRKIPCKILKIHVYTMLIIHTSSLFLIVENTKS